MTGNEQSDEVMEDISLEGIDPSAHAIVSRLTLELNYIKQMFTKAIEENKKLQEFINTNLPESRRKQPKGAQPISACGMVNNIINSDHTTGNGETSSAAAAANNNGNSHNNSGSATCNSVKLNSVNNKKKIFQAIDTNINSIRQSLINANCEHFTLRQFSNKAPIKISIDNVEEISAARSALVDSSISFHEFKWNSEKSKCFIIRGLVGVTSGDIIYIRQKLIEQGLPDSCSLSLYTTGYMRTHPKANHNTLLKLVVPPSFDTKLLMSIKYIDHVAVKFESIKNKAVIQCKNCQRFGHSSTGCKHAHRCVKCGLDHLKDSCPRSNNKGIKLLCCNCGGEHTANNLSVCQYFKNNYVMDAPIDNAPTKNKHNTASSATVTPLNYSRKVASVTYAAAAAAAASALKSPSKVQSTTYAPVVGSATSSSTNQLQSTNLAELASKIDVIYKLVIKHEAILQNRVAHE